MSAHFVSQTVRTATGQWPVILPPSASPCSRTTSRSRARPAAVKTAFVSTTRDGRGTGSAISAGPVTASTRWKGPVTVCRGRRRTGGCRDGDNASTLPPAAKAGYSQDKAEAQRKAAQQAQALVAAAQPQTGNAYLSAKGWPEVDIPTLQGQPLRVGGITFQPGDLLLPLYNAGEKWSTCS